jgi:hypothetical protein
MKTYGRCECSCECMNTAIMKVRSYMAPDNWWRVFIAMRSRWTHLCLDCAPHLVDQMRDRITKP